MTRQLARLRVLGAGIFSLVLVLGVARFSYTPLLPLMQQQAGLGVAAAMAVLDVIEEEKLLERSQALGARLTDFLRNLNAPEISEVRGLGSMVAAEFGDDEAPNGEFAAKVQKIAMENNLLLLTCGAHGNVIRFLYPLTIEDELFEQGLAVLEKAIEQARQA